MSAILQEITELSFQLKPHERIQISDGYNRFVDLYDQRDRLYIALIKEFVNCASENESFGDQKPMFYVWRSKKNYNGRIVGEGLFWLGIGKDPEKQIRLPLSMDLWTKCGFADTIDFAPEWNEASTDAIINRIEDSTQLRYQ